MKSDATQAMRIPLPPDLQPTNEMLRLIAAIDEFKGEWRALGSLDPGTLRSLRRIATIESAGSSTRIEGAKLSDSHNDDRHPGQWKSIDHHVAAFDTEGRQVGIVFETASPFETPMRMDTLLAWHAREEADPVLHPLLRIAVFTDKFAELVQKGYAKRHGKGRGAHCRRVNR